MSTDKEIRFQSVSELSADDLQALEAICLLICYLVSYNLKFVIIIISTLIYVSMLLVNLQF